MKSGRTSTSRSHTAQAVLQTMHDTPSPSLSATNHHNKMGCLTKQEQCPGRQLCVNHSVIEAVRACACQQWHNMMMSCGKQVKHEAALQLLHPPCNATSYTQPQPHAQAPDIIAMNRLGAASTQLVLSIPREARKHLVDTHTACGCPSLHHAN